MESICNSVTPDSIPNLLEYIICLFTKYILPLLVTLAVAGFVWGIVKFFMNPDNEEGRKKGKTFIVWGLIALFIIVSMWGIVGILGKTFFIETTMPGLPVGN